MEVTLVKILTKPYLSLKSENEKKNIEIYKTTLDKAIIAQIREK
jgi:hypothetical protein